VNVDSVVDVSEVHVPFSGRNYVEIASIHVLLVLFEQTGGRRSGGLVTCPG
jgi:hypothetical protein